MIRSGGGTQRRGSSTQRVGDWGEERAPKNALFHILYEMGRPLGFVAGAAEELYKRGTDEDYEAEPLYKAAVEGFKKVKSFNDFVDNPGAAFALNMGLDPVTYFGGPIIAGVKKAVTGTGRAATALGLTKLPPVANAIDTINAAKYSLRLKFVPGAALEMADDKGGTLLKLAKQNYILQNQLRRKLADEPAAAMRALAKNEEELSEIGRLLSLTPEGENLMDSLSHVPGEVVARFNQLSDGGKLAYQLKMQAREVEQLLKKEYGLVSAERMAGAVAKQKGLLYMAHLYHTGADEIATELYTKAALIKAAQKTVSDQDAAKINLLVPDEYKALGEYLRKPKSFPEFRKKVWGISPKSPVRKQVDDILWDESRQVFHRAKQSIENQLKIEGQVPDLWPRKMFEHLVTNPDGQVAKAVRRMTGKNLNFKGGFPVEGDLQVLAGLEAKTPFKSLKDFWKQGRKGITFAGKHIDETTLDDVADFSPGNTVKGMEAAADELRKMVTPARREWLQKIGKAVESDPALFPGLPKGFFEYTRGTVGSLDELAAAGLNHIETNIAKIQGAEGAEIGRVIAGRLLASDLMEEGARAGWVIPKTVYKDPIQYAQWMGKIAQSKGHDVAKIWGKRGMAELDAMPGMMAPRDIAEIANKAFAYTMDKKMGSLFAKGYVKWLGIWKAHTLSLFLPYHLRNAMSNRWNMFLEGYGTDLRDLGYDKLSYNLLVKFEKAIAKPDLLSPDERALYEELVDHGILNTGQTVGEAARQWTVSSKASALVNPKNWLYPDKNVAVQFGFNQARNIENHARVALYLWEKGKKGLSALEAADRVDHILFNYKTGLTPFENKWFRNGLVPFWAWTKFNVPLQFEMLAKYPWKYQMVYKGKQAVEDNPFSGPQPEEEYMQDWLRTSTNIRWKYHPDTGTYDYWMWDSWWPGADVNKLLSHPIMRDTIIGSITPFLKVPVEIYFNKDFYRKKDINEFKGSLSGVRGLTGGIHIPGGKEIPMPPEMEHVLRSIRYVNEMDRFWGGLEDQTPAGRIARAAIGRSYPYNPAKQKKRWLHDQSLKLSTLKYMEKKAIKEGDREKAQRLHEAVVEMERIIKQFK